MVRILIVKAVLGAVTGLVLDFLLRVLPRKPRKRDRLRDHHHDIHDLCEHEHCHCDRGILRPALDHTINIAAFIFIFTYVIGLGMELVGENTLAYVMTAFPIPGVAVSALVGLIPNCAAPVCSGDF